MEECDHIVNVSGVDRRKHPGAFLQSWAMHRSLLIVPHDSCRSAAHLLDCCDSCLQLWLQQSFAVMSGPKTSGTHLLSLGCGGQNGTLERGGQQHRGAKDRSHSDELWRRHPVSQRLFTACMDDRPAVALRAAGMMLVTLGSGG